MVRITNYAILLLLFIPMVLWGQEVKIDISLDQDAYYESQPITGMIQITHPSNERVDLKSFKAGGKPLKVDFIRDAKFGNLLLSIFHFQADPFPEGLQVFPAVSVKVGKEDVRSYPVSLNVKPLSTIQTSGAGKPFLKVEQILDRKKNLYPGEKITLGYRYLYQGQIDLDKEVLPMLDKSPFKKWGEKIIKDFTQGNLSISEITQVFQVEKAGDYRFGPSEIGGYAYVDTGGVKQYLNPRLSSNLEPFTLVVKQFPEANKPPFFSGAIGPFEISAKIDKPPKLGLNDPFKLFLTFSGSGVISTLKPVDLNCQPGFIGQFHTGDLPPLGTNNQNEQNFVYELRALFREVAEIKPIYFAYFDPDLEQYEIIKSNPIPLQVIGPPLNVSIPPPLPLNPKTTFQVLPFELKPHFSTLHIPFLGVRLLYTLALFSLIAFWLSRHFEHLREEKRNMQITPREYAEKAKNASNLNEFYHFAKLALEGQNDPKMKQFDQTLDGVKYGGISVPLPYLKEQISKFFILLFIPFVLFGASFYEDEVQLNWNIQESLKEGKWADAGFYFSLTDHKVESIYFYEKALLENPFDYEALTNLNKVQKLLSVPLTSPSYFSPQWFFYLSAILIFMLSLSFFILSRKLILLFSLFTLTMTVFSLIFFYNIPLKGVVIKADILKMEPSNQGPELGGVIISGTTVDILQEFQEGKWLKIKDNQGKIGFISFEKIRII